MLLSFSVESVAGKVLEKLFSTTNISPQALNPHAEFLLRNQIQQSNLLTNQNETHTPNNSFGHSTAPSKDSTSQMQDIGSKILRMFVIDKQMEGLMQEKKDIYKELLSIGEISASLVNSWAEEKIQKRNPTNVSLEQPNGTTSNLFTNPLANVPNLIPGLINESLSKSVQCMVSEPCTTNNLYLNTSPRNCVSSFPTQSRDTHLNNPIKLSVRTDLHNTNESPISNVFNKHPDHGPVVLKEGKVVKTEPCSEAIFENSSKKSKKKKKGKGKEKAEEIIYLIDDSTDEESCVSISSSSIGIDPLAIDESVPTTKNNETIINYNLSNKTPTSIYVSV